MFAHPISTTLNKVAGNLGSAENIEVGPLKIKFSAEALKALPAPSQEVSSMLAQLNVNDIERILSHGEVNGVSVCRESGLIASINRSTPL